MTQAAKIGISGAFRGRDTKVSSALPLAALGWSYFGFAFATHAFGWNLPPTCPFFLLTGHPCPLCGMTHAFGCLMSGNMEGAFHFNHFVVPAFAAWLAFTLICTATAYRRDTIGRRIADLGFLFTRQNREILR